MKHVSEVNTHLDAKDNKIQADAEVKETVDHNALTSPKLRALEAVGAIDQERLEAPVVASNADYAKFSTKLRSSARMGPGRWTTSWRRIATTSSLWRQLVSSVTFTSATPTSILMW